MERLLKFLNIVLLLIIDIVLLMVGLKGYYDVDRLRSVDNISIQYTYKWICNNIDNINNPIIYELNKEYEFSKFSIDRRYTEYLSSERDAFMKVLKGEMDVGRGSSKYKTWLIKQYNLSDTSESIRSDDYDWGIAYVIYSINRSNLSGEGRLFGDLGEVGDIRSCESFRQYIDTLDFDKVYSKYKSVYTNKDYVPSKGDIVFFINSNSVSYHISIVYDIIDEKMILIEGGRGGFIQLVDYGLFREGNYEVYKPNYKVEVGLGNFSFDNMGSLDGIQEIAYCYARLELGCNRAVSCGFSLYMQYLYDSNYIVNRLEYMNFRDTYKYTDNRILLLEYIKYEIVNKHKGLYRDLLRIYDADDGIIQSVELLMHNLLDHRNDNRDCEECDECRGLVIRLSRVKSYIYNNLIRLDKTNGIDESIEKSNKYRERFIWPVYVYSNFVSTYGHRDPGVVGASRYHLGLDIAPKENKYNTIIHAADDGVVCYIGTHKARGKFIVIDHGNGYKTVYQHCSKMIVELGDYVNIGESIAYVGNTGVSGGPHCHFEIWHNEVLNTGGADYSVCPGYLMYKIPNNMYVKERIVLDKWPNPSNYLHHVWNKDTSEWIRKDYCDICKGTPNDTLVQR